MFTEVIGVLEFVLTFCEACKFTAAKIQESNYKRHQPQNMITEESRGVSCPIASFTACLTSLENFENHYNAQYI